ncbi:hypothetical protein ACFX15_020234 [Malus domestica]
MPLVCGSITTTWVKLWSPVLRAPRVLPEHSNIDFRRSHKLLGDEFHYGQAEVLGKEMADFDGSSQDLLRTSQIRRIRCKMREIMVAWATTSDLNDFVKRLMAESIGRDIEKEMLSIFPLQNVFIHKVKMLKAPKFDLDKLMYIHGYEDLGVKVESPDHQEETALE